MVSDPSLNAVAVRLAESVRRFADNRGWPWEAYRVWMYTSLQWDHLGILLLSDLVDRSQPYADRDLAVEIRQLIREELRDAPELFRHVGVSVWPLSGFNARRYQLEGAEWFDDALLNPGVRDVRGDVERHEQERRSLIPR